MYYSRSIVPSAGGEGARRRRPIGGRCAFTLVELLVVIGIIAVLMGILLPALGSARRQGELIKCLSNMRQLATAQMAYANTFQGRVVTAGGGAGDEQGSWINTLEPYAGTAPLRRCPSDRSPYFEEPLPSSSPPAHRTSSYAINNYLSPTHAPPGFTPIHKITQVRDTTLVVQFAELAETGSYAGADHLHVNSFYLVIAPQLTAGRAAEQLSLGRHDGREPGWQSRLNYSFLDGHAETAAFEDVYTDPTKNRFNPLVAR